MDFKAELLRQSPPRTWLGALRIRIQRVQTYYAFVNLVLLLVTTYTIREASIKQYIPRFNFWWLLILGAVLIVGAALIDYKLVHPSEIAYNQSQAWKHKNPVRRELGRLEESINQLQILGVEDVKALTDSIDLLRQSVDRLEIALREFRSSK